MEEALTFLDIEIQRRDDPFIRTQKESIIAYIKLILVEISGRAVQGGSYHKLAKILGSNDSVITFNWDTMLEEIFSQHGLSIHANYRKEFFEHQTSNQMKARLPYDITPHSSLINHYIKLHGSLDWYDCRNSACRQFKLPFCHNPQFERPHCGECNENMAEIIIPPLLTKNFDQFSVIRKSWHLAGQVIRQARSIIFWGYSLPPTDFAAKYLFLNNKAHHLQNITLINPEVIPKAKKPNSYRFTFIRKFYDMYRSHLNKTYVYLYENFDDFSNDLTIEAKYSISRKNLLAGL